MKRKKVIFLVVVVFCLSGAIWGWVAFHKTRPSLASVKPDIRISAKTLYDAFNTDELNANKHYLNMVLEVEGMVASVQQGKTQTVIELSGGGNAMGGINCAMRSNDNIPHKGMTVHIKGRCTGFLMDVNLVDAVNVTQ